MCSLSLQIALLQQFPQLKQMVRPAIEKAVQDLLAPVVERSIKIALTTAENIVKKVICDCVCVCECVHVYICVHMSVM